MNALGVNVRARSTVWHGEQSSQRGQATVLTLVFLVVLLGMAALVLDFGSWYRADRDTQSTADAAALAGAQALPDDTGEAQNLAANYATKNGGGLDATTISSSINTDDTIQVAIKRQAPGIFTKIFGFNSATVGSKATARVGPLAQALYVAPIVVNLQHPALHCGGTQQRPTPCFGQPTELDLLDLHSPGGGNAAGSFGLIDLTGELGGNVGATDLASWMEHGYDKMMPLGKYSSAPSANFNNGQFQNALQDRIGDDVLFPIYDTLTGPGTGAQYNVIGWIGFHVTSFNANGSNGWVRGWFTKVIWSGIQSTTSSGSNWGAKTIQLVN
jgi:secretion/DNA translocation related TadE-like protein